MNGDVSSAERNALDGATLQPRGEPHTATNDDVLPPALVQTTNDAGSSSSSSSSSSSPATQLQRLTVLVAADPPLDMLTTDPLQVILYQSALYAEQTVLS